MRTANNNMYQGMSSLNTSFNIYKDFYIFTPRSVAAIKGQQQRREENASSWSHHSFCEKHHGDIVLSDFRVRFLLVWMISFQQCHKCRKLHFRTIVFQFYSDIETCLHHRTQFLDINNCLPQKKILRTIHYFCFV